MFCYWFSTQPYLSLGINQFEQNYGLSLFDSGSPRTDVNEQLRTTYYDLGGGIELDLPLFCNLSAFISVGGFASFASTTFNGKQIYFNDGIEELFNIKDENNTVKGKLKASLGVEANCRGIDIGVIGRYEYWGYLPQVLNAATEPALSSINSAFLSTCSIGFYAQVNY